MKPIDLPIVERKDGKETVLPPLHEESAASEEEEEEEDEPPTLGEDNLGQTLPGGEGPSPSRAVEPTKRETQMPKPPLNK